MTPEARRKLIRELNTRYRFTPTMVASVLQAVEELVEVNPAVIEHPSYPLGYIFAWATTYGVVLSDYEK
jgi:hypothetical protein